MTDAAQVALITVGGMAITALISTGGVIVNGIVTRRAITRTDAKVDELKKNTDGMQSTLLELNEAKGHAAGIAEGRQAATDERKDRVTESERVEDRQAGITLTTEKVKDQLADIGSQVESVAADLVGSHTRADAVEGKPGAAADAAMKLK